MLWGNILFFSATHRPGFAHLPLEMLLNDVPHAQKGTCLIRYKHFQTERQEM